MLNDTPVNKSNRGRLAKSDVDKRLEDIGDLLRTIFVLSILGGAAYLLYIIYKPSFIPGVFAYAGGGVLILSLLLVGILRRRVVLRTEYREEHRRQRSAVTNALYSPCPCWEIPHSSRLGRWNRKWKTFTPKTFKKCHNNLLYWRIDRFLYRGSLLEFVILGLLLALTPLLIYSLIP